MTVHAYEPSSIWKLLNKIDTYQAHMYLNILIKLLRLYICFDGRLTYAAPEKRSSWPQEALFDGAGIPRYF